MNKATFHSLTAAEQSLMLETERPRLLEHDEAELIAVVQRVTKQRAKAVSQYRRAASARVEAKGARGKQRLGGPHRDALKAEAWEDALARVSSRLAALARAQSRELKAERLAAARGEGRAGSPPPAARSTTSRGPAGSRARTPAPIERKRAASQKSAGKRRQASRDARTS
jgi:hypothetical protein